MKPDRRQAMLLLIEQIRLAMPFHLPQERLCQGPCQGCPKKLLEYLDLQLEQKMAALESNEIPTLGEIQRLARTARRIHQVLEKNQLLTP